MEKYRIHALKTGDTIVSVALELGISILELRGFHNIYCENQDTIGYDFPDHIKEIFVFPHIREYKKENHPMVQFTDGSALVYKKNKKKLNYGVMCTIWSGEQVNTLKYHVSVAFKEETAEGFHFEIDRISKTFVNDLECNSTTDELADKVSKIIYPVNIVMSKVGEFVEVSNFEKIQKRWKTGKEKILDEYEGEWVEKYLALSEQSLQSGSIFTQSLQKDWFLSSYFSKIYCNYWQQFRFENSVLFPLLPHVGNIKYTIEQKIDPYLDENKQILIEQNGIMNDPRAKADFENESNFPDCALQDPKAAKTTGDFKAFYVLDSKSHSIESVFLESSIELEESQKVQVVISLLNS